MKYRVILRYENKYSISAMCRYFEVSRSGYYGWAKRAGTEDKDIALTHLIRQCHEKTRQTYGYQRIKLWFSETV